jgi:hypothetical protein
MQRLRGQDLGRHEHRDDDSPNSQGPSMIADLHSAGARIVPENALMQWSLNGLTGNETNPIPGSNGGTFSVHANTQPVTIGDAGPGYPASAVPLIDPGEPFDQMAQQYLSLSAVPSSNPYTKVLTWSFQITGSGLTAVTVNVPLGVS